jgi:hypothetical protein
MEEEITENILHNDALEEKKNSEQVTSLILGYSS